MNRKYLFIALAALLLATPLAWSPAATAQTPAPAADASSDVCTSFKTRQDIFDSSGDVDAEGNYKPGMMSEIYTYVTDIVDGSTKKLYESFINNNAYRAAVGGAMTLMIIIFGVGFMIGIIQPSFGQALIRLIKFGIIAALIAPSGWAFFNSSDNGGAGVVQFFNDGTDELIVGVTKIGTGVENIPAGATPFYQLDKIADYVIQPDSIILIMGAAFGSGPYGMAVSGLIAIAFFSFIKLLITALRTYAVSYVARSLLLGVAPIFIVFLLFDRTKQLFMSWVNALVSLSLQPILLFTFLSFFLVLIESATKDMLNSDLCWTEYENTVGTTDKKSFWRLVDKDTNKPITSQMTWEGAMSCVISESGGDCPEFPINIIDVLTFLILVYLASRFAEVVVKLANELSNTFIALDPGGRFAQIMEQTKAKEDTNKILTNKSRTT